jgi:hypothetical protein
VPKAPAASDNCSVNIVPAAKPAAVNVVVIVLPVHIGSGVAAVFVIVCANEDARLKTMARMANRLLLINVLFMYLS